MFEGSSKGFCPSIHLCHRRAPVPRWKGYLFSRLALRLGGDYVNAHILGVGSAKKDLGAQLLLDLVAVFGHLDSHNSFESGY